MLVFKTSKLSVENKSYSNLWNAVLFKNKILTKPEGIIWVCYCNSNTLNGKESQTEQSKD